jgi:hypothetical protein
MMKTLIGIASSVSVAVPLFAHAQAPADVAYRKKLSKTSRSAGPHSRSSHTATVPEALSKCETAPEASIPVLEKL